MGNSLLPRMSALLLLFGTGTAALAQPARIIAIRHAEKPAEEQDPELSAAGRARAQWLVTWFSEEESLVADGPPVALYAPEPSAHGRGLRCLRTLEPLGRHLNLPIRTPHRPDEYAKLAKNLLRSVRLKGKTVVVCWTHEELPKLAAALGVTPAPPKWKDKDFDSVYIVTFQDGKAHLATGRQRFKKKQVAI